MENELSARSTEAAPRSSDIGTGDDVLGTSDYKSTPSFIQDLSEIKEGYTDFA